MCCNNWLRLLPSPVPMRVWGRLPQTRIGVHAIIILLVSINCFAEEQFKYDPKGARDPFVPLISEEGGLVSDAYSIAAFGEVRLEGIVWDDSGPSMALINGELVKEGDVLGEAKVLKIEKDSVKLDIGGEEVLIRLSSE